jgi:hypothetical protein
VTIGQAARPKLRLQARQIGWLLLAFVPLAVAAELLHWGPLAVFLPAPCWRSCRSPA